MKLLDIIDLKDEKIIIYQYKLYLVDFKKLKLNNIIKLAKDLSLTVDFLNTEKYSHNYVSPFNIYYENN